MGVTVKDGTTATVKGGNKHYYLGSMYCEMRSVIVCSKSVNFHPKTSSVSEALMSRGIDFCLPASMTRHGDGRRETLRTFTIARVMWAKEDLISWTIVLSTSLLVVFRPW